MHNQAPHKFEEVTVSTQQIFQGRLISLRVDQVVLPNGQQTTREIVNHPGAVAVMAFVDQKLLVVEQYRKALEKSQIEIPAGKLDPGEEPIDAAYRELEEETGYRAESLTWVTSFYTSPGFADEILHLYVAEQLYPSKAHLDEDEFLECKSITLEQAEQYIAEAKISDAKTILAIYAWKLHVRTGKFS